MTEPLNYHHGQLQVQEEANTRQVADKLAHWIGPVDRYALGADLFLFALADGEMPAASPIPPALRFAALSGPAPLVAVSGPGRLRLDSALSDLLRLQAPTAAGGLVINQATGQRARVNGMLGSGADGLEIQATELFTLCRKYILPSAAFNEHPIAGPLERQPIALDDPWVSVLLGVAESAYLASVSPRGAPDVAHRGGPAGFLTLDRAAASLSWTEFVGDGVFKSAGNVRATAVATLLVPDLSTGDALELQGEASYETLRVQRRPRQDPLVRLREPFPEQGRMVLRIRRAFRLSGLAWPRQLLRGERVTSSSSVDDQAPD